MPRLLCRRTRIRSVTYLAAAFLLLAGTVVQQNMELIQYRRLASNSYTHAFSELSASMNQMATNLEKQTCVTSPSQIAALSAEIHGQSQAAQQAIGELPYADVELEQTAAFVSKVGDYAQAVSRSAAANGGYSGDELKNVKALAKVSKTLSASLDDLEGKLYSGDVALEDLEAVENRLTGTQTTRGRETSESRFKTVETDFPELPTLIYDGPFSDSLQSRKRQGAGGAGRGVPAQARRAAAEFLRSIPTHSWMTGPLPETYPPGCSGSRVKKGSCSIRVTKAGGKVLNMLCSREVKGRRQPGGGSAEGQGLLQARGYTDLVENYYSEANGALTINFTAVQDDALLYPPDLD